VARKPQEAQKTAVLGPPSSTARGRPNAHRSDLNLLPGLRVHLEAPPRPDNNRVSPRVHDRTPPPLHTTATPPRLPLKESTHNKALLSPEDQGFVCCRPKYHEASARQAAWPNLGTSGARKPISGVISCRPQRGGRRHSTPARCKRTPAPQKSAHQHRPTPGPTHFGAFRRRRCAGRSPSARCRSDEIQR
jgi:hypothetical protein